MTISKQDWNSRLLRQEYLEERLGLPEAVPVETAAATSSSTTPKPTLTATNTTAATSGSNDNSKTRLK